MRSFTWQSMRTEAVIYDPTRCKAPPSFQGYCHLLWGLHERGLSRFHLPMMHVWHGIFQFFNTCVMISGTLLLFSSDVSGQFCVEWGFEENCLGEECCVLSTSCRAWPLHNAVLSLSINLCPQPPQILARHVFIVTIVAVPSCLQTRTYTRTHTQAKVEFCLSRRELMKTSSSLMLGLLTLPLKVGVLKWRQ